jgi:cobalt-zinc-cadmium resistance protein CzcA
MNEIVAFALKQRGLFVVLFVLVLGAGLTAFVNLNIEAYPDPVPPLIDVITQSPGDSAEDIERYVTVPIEIQMSGIPNVTAIRTISLFGLSDTKVQFTYDVTYEQAEQYVLNRLSQLPPLKGGVLPGLSYESPIGEIYRYRVIGPPGFSTTDLKTLEDWVLVRRFKAVPGVADVVSWGGKTKVYDVVIDQRKLISYGLTLQQVLQTLNNSNVNVGGQTIEIGPQAAVVRGIGLIRSMDQVRNTTLSSQNGTPILLSDIATVSVGNEPRLGIAGQDRSDDIVEGIVLMRRGAQSGPTIDAVEKEVAKINGSGLLPPGVRIEKIYDRRDLIDVTTGTVLHNMIAGMVLIFFIQWLFLGNLRSAAVVAATIPFALSFAILIMTLRGESANLLSVGAIDFGLVVDATVIMVENIFSNLSGPHGRPGSLALRNGAHSLGGKLAAIAAAASEVNRAIFFSAAIIIAGFVPLFTMSGIEGHIFGPMARTYAYAILGGLIATFTVSPALAAYLLPERTSENESLVGRYLKRFYMPVLEFALANKILTLGCAGLVMVLAIAAGMQLGSEFLPHLEEGNLWIRATMPTSIALSEGDGYANRMRALIASYPEAQTVISQHGRPDDGTDATGFFNVEFFVPLKPFDKWPSGMDKDRLTAELKSRLESQFPGVDFNFSQYIEDNVEESASGVKGQNSVKLYGNDLQALEKTAAKIKDVMAGVPGITDLAVLTMLGQPTVAIEVDRSRIARYGLTPGDVNATVQAAIGGEDAGNLYEEGSDRYFPLKVRFAPEYRESIDAIKRITIGVPSTSGNGVVQIPLSDVADITLNSGASFIYRENQERYIPIKFSVRGRDLGGAVSEAQQRIAQQVSLPPGYRLEWVGEFGEFLEALQRLAIAVPLSIFLVGILLYLNFGALSDALLAGSVIPMALVGGILALFVTGISFSVSAAIGFVALFGIAAMDGILVLSCYNRMIDDGKQRTEALLQSCEAQLRPVMMTCLVACVGLLPAAVSTGIGSQVQKPLAIVVVGGILLAPLLILVVLPILIDLFSRRAAATESPHMQAIPAE